MRGFEAADTLIARVLFVTPQPEALAASSTRVARRAFNASLLFSALRCTVQYVILPFVLPLVGIATGPPISVMILLDAIAFVSLVASLRRFWHVRHPRRWDYLPLALVMALVILVFLAYDIRVLAR